MTKEELDPLNPNFSYEIEEEEDEEIITLDFDNQKAYLLENQAYFLKTEDNVIHNLTEDVKEIPVSPTSPSTPADPFKNELQDLLLNSITSKAVGSLLAKHRDLDNQFLGLMAIQRMGELGDMLESDMLKIMEGRRNELRQCFGGPQIKYDRIPSWARSYVKQYIEHMVHELAIATENKRN